MKSLTRPPQPTNAIAWLRRASSFLSFVCLVGLWELTARSGVVSRPLFPAPSRVAQALVEMSMSGELIRDAAASYSRIAVGFSVAACLAVPIGLATGRSRVVGLTVAPIVQSFRPLPPVAIIPLIIVWFGIGEAAKMVAIAFGVFFPVWLNTHLGAERIPQRFIWGATTLTPSHWRLFSRVLLPASLPFIIAGLRVGIGVAFVMVFVAELAGASQGIGHRVSVEHLAYRMDRMLAALVVLGGSGAMADQLFATGVCRLFPWTNATTRHD